VNILEAETKNTTNSSLRILSTHTINDQLRVFLNHINAVGV